MLKVVVDGSKYSGKSSFLRAAQGETFVEWSPPIGLPYISIAIGGHSIQLWEVTGADRYANLGKYNYKSAHAAIFMFALDEERSFLHALRLIDQLL